MTDYTEHNFPEPKVVSLNSLFYSTISLNVFIVIYDKLKQEIVTFKKLEPVIYLPDK